MAPRRQRLSQRRKVAEMAKGSLAEGLGVRRSTVARWEAADTQPLPSIQPDVAVSRSLRVTPVAQPVSAKSSRPVVVDADPEAAIAPSPILPGRLADIDHPANINIVGADMRPFEPAPITVEVGGYVGSCVPEPGQADLADFSSAATVPLNIPLPDVQRRPAKPRRFTRFAAAGVLALIGSAASVSFLTPDNGLIPPATAGIPVPAAPVAAIPAPDPASSNEVTGAPPAARNKPADAPAALVSTPAQTARSTSRSRLPAPTMTAHRPRTRPIPAEAYGWSHMAELSKSDHSRARVRRGLPSPP
jgi:hypothetical protein